MSFLNDINVCKEMVMEEEFEKSCSIEYGSSEFVVLPKYEEIEESLIVGEEIVVDTNIGGKLEISETSNRSATEPNVYYEECLDASANITVDYEEPCSSAIMDKEDWHNDSDKHTYIVSDMIKSEIPYKSDGTVPNDQDPDEEETIATFVTAAGQQLALYAVEDSDEIFAVAVYDESGEPPTNFQFLMKADVERLIGEGAVRTVKKPTQIKKQLLTTQSPLFFPNDTVQELSENNGDKTVIEKSQNEQDHCEWGKNEQLSEQSSMELETNPKILYTTADKQPDITYLMMDDSVNIGDRCEATQEEVESDNDIIEQSTVQYILLEGDQSDSELTFDEIQTTLQNLKSESRSLVKKSKSTKSSDQNDNESHMMILSSNVKQQLLSQSCSMDRTNIEYVQNTSCTVSNYSLNSSPERKRNCSDRQALLNVLDDPTPTSTSDSKLNSVDASLDPSRTLPQSGQTVLRAKRSRKQQLTSVNRDDSEIIIQPASLLNEEENNVRKRGKRRKKLVSHSSYQRRGTESRRMRKIQRKEVEVIEIDVDEEENTRRANGDVVEITIDDNKDKCSSDKENEIIMVGDSDEETQEVDVKLSTSLLRCEHCSRNFRQQRALDTHLRVCSKSPANSLKINAQNQLNGKTIKKEYACKICQEKFDVVVALARHVRSLHSQRKKRRPSKSSVEEDSEESSPADTAQDKIPILSRTRKKNPNSWEVKKLNCVDCGRWFPSAALLNAHCLQHGTKRTEKQIRRCQICKKLIKSRVLFIRHLKMHSRSNKQNTSSSVLEKKMIRTTRQVTRKLTTLRKRGRPRKL